MGDRANVFVTSDGREGVYLYTHWGGHRLPKIVQAALQRKQRWNDELYLNRIIFCEMIKGQESSETGFGIGTYIGDGGDRVIHVNVEKQELKLNDKTYSFEKYIELELENIEF